MSKNMKKWFAKLAGSVNDQVKLLNNSKIFAGIMIIVLNISSRFVNIKLGKTMESYLKHSFSKQLLVFTIAWMGTRDIYIALIVSTVFVILTEYLLHEESPYCILSRDTCNYYIEKMENMEDVSEDEIKKAKGVIEKAASQGKIDLEAECANLMAKSNGSVAEPVQNSYNTDFTKMV